MAGKHTITGRAVLNYDADCPVCRKTISWIRNNMRKDAFEMLPCQSEDVQKKFPFIEQAVCMRAMQLILPDGKVLGGEKALPEILKRLRRYASTAALFELPGSEAVARSFYRWFANNRYHIANVLLPKNKKDKKRTTKE